MLVQTRVIPFAEVMDAVYGKRLPPMARSFTILFVTSFLGATTACPQGQGSIHLRIGLITPATSVDLPVVSSIERGVKLGATEANQTAALFGGDVQLFEVFGTGEAATTAASRLLSARKVQILIGASAADADALSRLAESRHVIFLNTASRAESLRSACRRFTFHIEATDAMYTNASRLHSVVLWGPGLQRFGASQLNDRYRDKYHEGMDGNAWAGWAAVKIAADAALRAQSAAPARLLAYLESPSTEFDGHKGWPLTFRLADHQLRQPLYIVVTKTTGGRRVQSYEDVPELRAVREDAPPDDSETLASDRALDALIGTTGAACHWGGK